jgi:hypothetical protein
MGLGVILDAMEGKQRSPLDFENLKRDLRELGSNLRAGFEEAKMIKRTQRLDQTTAPNTASRGNQQGWQMPNWSREFEKALRKVKAAHTRKYSLQQGILSILGGGAFMAIWYHLLNVATDSGLIRSIELIILQQTGAVVQGLEQFLRVLWLLGAIPVARGVGHLINGIFIAPRKIEQTEQPVVPMPGYVYPSPVSYPAANPTTNELDKPQGIKPQSSVTEDETLRFEPR